MYSLVSSEYAIYRASNVEYRREKKRTIENCSFFFLLMLVVVSFYTLRVHTLSKYKKILGNNLLLTIHSRNFSFQGYCTMRFFLLDFIGTEAMEYFYSFLLLLTCISSMNAQSFTREFYQASILDLYRFTLCRGKSIHVNSINGS